jgi:beta-ureidopropionase / N-carbamoyl-L-amino-acid hydrolase
MSLDPKRTVRELKELRALTATEDGAQRVAWTDVWLKSRTWFESKLLGLPVEHHFDAAGNRWVTLPGASERALILGSHLDSVPNGGWLDGSLGVLAALEVLRRIANEHKGRPPVTIRLVDFADEEGARFGRSLLGSSAFAGTHSVEADRVRTDKDGIRMDQALSRCGVEMDQFPDAASEQRNAAAYLELHIEQGPVLLDLGLPLGTVLGTYGVERHAMIFHGQAAHSGSTPMNRRKDAFLAAARMSPLIYELAQRHGGVCTIGSCTTKPGIVTSVVEECRITLDQRHLDAAALGRLLADARAASERFAAEGNVRVVWERIWQIEPVLFNEELRSFCDAAITECGAPRYRLPSGPLHDAAEVARAGVPTVMMFVQSLHGISHNKIEDTKEEHIEWCVRAFDNLAEKTIAWIKAKP